MNMKKTYQSRNSGSALVFAVFAVLLLSVMGGTLLSLGLNQRVFAIRNAEQVQARSAADAGLTKALFEMNKKLKAESWSDISLPVVTGEALLAADATFDYTVSGDDSNGYTIQCIGYRNQSQKAVSTTLDLKGLFEHAILTKESLILKAGMLIDGYNSQDPNKTDVDLTIGTASILSDQIDLKAGVVIGGDVLVGVNGDPATVIKDSGATTGDRYAVTEEPLFPEVTPPSLSDKGSLLVNGTTLTIDPAASGKYTSVSIQRGSVVGILEVTGGEVVMHVTGEITLQESCEITIAVDSTLILYVDGDISTGTDSSMGYQGSPEEPEHLKIYGTASGTQAFNIKAKSAWSGIIYAPNADITVNAQGDVYGSFVGNSVEYKANGDLYYDENLKNASVNDEGARFVVKRWRE